MGDIISKIPKGLWVAAVLAAAGFFVHIYSANVVTENGAVTSCTYTDFGALIFAALAVVVAVGAAMSNRKQHPKRRAPEAVVWGLTVVIAIVAAILVMRGLGVIDSYCAAVSA